MSKMMSYYEWLDYMGIEEDTDESYDAYLEAKRNMSPNTETHYCPFEGRICKYASKRGSVFDCKAPSDAKMICG